MVAEPRSSDQVDPPSAYSGFSFFSKILPDPSKPYDTDADIVAFNNHLKSLALRSPNKLLEEAKTFLDGSSELLDSEIANFLAPKDKNEVGAAEGKVNLQERRPALGRKRARFSLKPNPSQPAVNLEPSLDIDQLKDPEEFFLAYERLENAKRELQKQMGGVSMDLNQHNPLTTARQRRPGILGRSVRYKHRYSSVVSENNENVVSSQETFESDILSPSNHILQQETGEIDQNVASQESELADIPEKKVSEILEELLSGNLEDLEGDGAVSLLQKRLQMKPIDVEKLCLPELQDIQKIDLKSSRGKFPRHRKALSDIDNLLKGVSSKTPGKLIQEPKNSVHHIASPTPPRSPFGFLSSLQRRILRSNPSSNPFSVHDVDHSPARSSSPIECMNKQSDLHDAGKRLSICDELMSPLTEEDDNAIAKTGSPEVDIGNLTHTSVTIVHDNLSNHSVGIDVGLSGTHVDTENNIGGSTSDNMVMDEQSSRHDAETIVHDNLSNHFVGIDVGLSGTRVDMEDNIGGSTGDNMVMDEQSSRHNAETIVHDNSSKHSVGIDVGSSGTHVDMDDKIGGNIRDEMVMDEQSSRHDAGMDTRANEPNELEDMVEDMLPEAVASAQPNLNMVDLTGENLNCSQSLLEQSRSAVIEDHSVDGHSKAPENDPEQHIEESTRVSPKEQNKEKSRPRRERKSKELSRKSLAGAGTMWEAGIRRSTRIRTRPLEYWKGEKLLYGRVHQSLTTVIGLKYLSPAKGDGEPTLKVKSYVSDEHKELLELAALH